VEISADADYGLGWIIEDYDGLEIISHAGNTFGYSSEFAFAPQADLGVVILTNQRASAFNPFVRSWLFERLYQNEPETEELMEFVIKQQEEGASSIRRRLVDQIEFEDIEQFLGSYHEKALGSAELRWQDDQLYIDFGLYQNEIRALENDGEIEYSTYSPPTAGLPIKLELDSDENPTMTLGLGLVEYIFTKDV
jgi:CubicO group peptidase (beta-lactamase class C family)